MDGLGYPGPFFMTCRKVSMIILKSQGEIDALCAAGALSAKALRMTGEMVKPGVSTLELDEYCESIIRMGGGLPGFKGYGGFPGTICASVNEQVVHGFPSADVILQEGDIISIDTGAVVDGWYGDNAWTFPVGWEPPRAGQLLDEDWTFDDGAIDPETARLLRVTQRSLFAGIAAVSAGGHIGDIGHVVQQIAEGEGFGVIREYVGHGVGRDMHEDPNVPNYGHRNRGERMDTGLVIAIEPMITQGSRRVKTISNGWTVVTCDGLPAAHFEKTIAITEDGVIIVSKE